MQAWQNVAGQLDEGCRLGKIRLSYFVDGGGGVDLRGCYVMGACSYTGLR